MKRLLTFAAIAVLFGSFFGAVLSVRPTKVAAAQVAQNSAQAQPTQTAEVVYKYIAQPGDSYSVIARKAVQTYGLKNKVNLSNARIIFAETNLTKDAGSPYLNLGQNLELKESAVKTVIEKAQKLTTAQEAAWNVYAQGVNFNTNLVGQSK